MSDVETGSAPDQAAVPAAQAAGSPVQTSAPSPEWRVADADDYSRALSKAHEKAVALEKKLAEANERLELLAAQQQKQKRHRRRAMSPVAVAGSNESGSDTNPSSVSGLSEAGSDAESSGSEGGLDGSFTVAKTSDLLSFEASVSVGKKRPNTAFTSVPDPPRTVTELSRYKAEISDILEGRGILGILTDPDSKAHRALAKKFDIKACEAAFRTLMKASCAKRVGMWTAITKGSTRARPLTIWRNLVQHTQQRTLEGGDEIMATLYKQQLPTKGRWVDRVLALEQMITEYADAFDRHQFSITMQGIINIIHTKMGDWADIVDKDVRRARNKGTLSAYVDALYENAVAADKMSGSGSRATFLTLDVDGSAPKPRGTRGPKDVLVADTGGGGKRKETCRYCGEAGHWFRECPHKATINKVAGGYEDPRGKVHEYYCTNHGANGSHATKSCKFGSAGDKKVPNYKASAEQHKANARGLRKKVKALVAAADGHDNSKKTGRWCAQTAEGLWEPQDSE